MSLQSLVRIFVKKSNSISKMSLLEYEHQIILDAFHDDGLLVMARGLGIERIFSNFLKVYCDPKNLVLVLNTTQPEEEYFIEQLDSEEIRPLPKQVTADLNVNDRRSVYMEGGALFVTSRILVVDLLTDRLPTDLVTGILVYKAHKVIDTCQEAFILRLFRQKNKTGFVKAFSDSPQSFTAGFCQVEKVMKSLFVRKLFLWPRFHASVSSCFDAHQVDVVELHLHLTQSMTACQTALLDLIDACIKEVKRSNPSLDTDEITVETSLTRNFDKIIRLQLDPVWHQLGPRTRQLVADIKTLRLMLQYLPQYDCVNFFNLVNSVRTNEKEFGKNSGWMFMDAADSLFAHAKLRLFGEIKKAKKSKTDENKASSDKDELVPAGPQVLEECPKWKVLREVLDEIEADSKEADPSLGPSRVIVAAQDDRTCSQIREFLSDGSQVMLHRLYNKTIGFKTGSRLRGEQGTSSRQTKGNKMDKPEKNWTLTQMIKENEKSDTDRMEADVQGTPPEDSMYKVLDCPFTVIYPLHGSQDPHSLTRVLHKLEPRYVVLYDADMAFVRQLELFRATRPGKPLRVYFMMYAGSTEEQRYLTTLRKEKESFEYLIRQKATMVIPEEREGRLENDPNLTRDTTPANATVSTRKGGQQTTNVQQKIIVDMREFRSELPSLIHKRGIEIEPVTIDVGDYILTPDICVERKSVSDLIGSLNNGRLYNQATSMCRYYKRPILLIEFDTNKPFSLQGKSFMSSEINSSDVTSRLTLLTLHFPRLRILWCQSPHATAELFHELKMGRAQPEAAAAMSVGGEEGSEVESAKYSHEPKALLLKMPGINTKNVHAIMNRVKDLSELVTLTEEQLTQTLESQAHARLLWNFIHSRHDPTQVSTSATGGEGRGKGMPRGGATGKRPSATNMATGGKRRK